MASPPSPSALTGREPRREAADAAVELAQVTRVFGSHPALVRVDLRVEPGEVLLVRGPNGAGKSTLLRVVATALSPTYGSGRVLGHDLVAGRAEIRARTELLGHRTRLYEDLTALENLTFACRMHGIDPGEAPAALDRVGLARSAGDRVRGFSQGMRQRVALARLLLRRPELLLLDEPYAGLDDEGRELVDGEIAAARAAGRTVLLATHEPMAAALATRSVSIEGGRLREGA